MARLHTCAFCSPTAPPPAIIVDGRTKMGPWGWMCLTHHKIYGVGTGLGKGQVFGQDKVTGNLIKMEG